MLRMERPTRAGWNSRTASSTSPSGSSENIRSRVLTTCGEAARAPARYASPMGRGWAFIRLMHLSYWFVAISKTRIIPSEFSKPVIGCMLYDCGSSPAISAVRGEIIFGRADYRSGIAELQKPLSPYPDTLAPESPGRIAAGRQDREPGGCVQCRADIERAWHWLCRNGPG